MAKIRTYIFASKHFRPTSLVEMRFYYSQITRSQSGVIFYENNLVVSQNLRIFATE